jgi:DNA-binding NarL/FixJ family response regulator
VLIVEDDPIEAEHLLLALGDWGYRTALAASVREASEQLKRVPGLSAGIFDYYLPDGSGLTAVALAREHWPDLPSLVVSHSCDPAIAARAYRALAWYAVKPFPPALVRQFVDRVAPPAAPDRVVGSSAAAIAVRRLASRFRLTPTQERIVQAAVLDDRRASIALELDMRASTLRTHIAAILERTACEDLRQVAALVRLDMAGAEPGD